MNIFKSIIDTVGHTPLVRLNHLTKDCVADVYLKLEFFNPLGSVKDRIAVSMIEGAEKAGTLKKGMKVLESTSGNTGIGLAFVCAARGYPLTLVMPDSMSMERRVLFMLLGAEVLLTPAENGMPGAMAKALELADQDKNFFIPGQFDNPDNPKIHSETTGPEIWADTEGKIDIFISAVGTGGTLTGTGRYLKEKNAAIKIIAVEPVESPVLSGGGEPGPHKIQGIGAGFVPNILDKSLIDEVETVTSDEALATARNIIKGEGIPVGISSGAAVAAALRQGEKPENAGKVIVAIIPSYTERYLSTLLADVEREKAAALPTEAVNDLYIQKVKDLYKNNE